MPTGTDTASTETRRTSALRRGAEAVLKLTVSGVLLWLILQRFAFEDLKGQVLQTRPRALLLPLGIVLLSNVLGALQWSWILRSAGVVVGWSRALGLYFSGLFLNHFLVGSLGGDVYKIYRLGRQQDAMATVAGATLVDRLVGVSALCVLAWVAALVSFGHGGVPAEVAGLILAFTAGVAAVALVLLQGRPGGWVLRLVQALPGGLARRGTRLVEQVQRYRARARLLNGVFLLSLGIQSARVLAHYFVGLAMGWQMGPTDLGRFFLVIPILGLIIALPISVGGWGVREWAGIALWEPLGRNGEEAVTLLALTATLTFAVSLAGGVFLLAESWRPGRGPAPASVGMPGSGHE